MLRRVIAATVAVAAGLCVLNYLLDGLELSGTWSAILAATALSAANATLWPVLARLTLPISVVTLGLGSLALNAAMTFVVLDAVPGVRIDGVGTALLVTVGLSVLTALVLVVLSIDDESVFDERMVRQMRRRTAPVADAEPGTVFVQIDGLSLDVLRRAVRSGDVAVLASWLREGSHRLVPWETEWSSQTGVSQAGILLGSTEDMPAFRWYEKENATTVVSNRPASAALIESRRLEPGGGLLGVDGASYGNLYAGGAERAALTMSVVGKRKGRFGEGYGPYLSHPRNLIRTVLGVIADVVRERRAAREQVRRDIRPRIRRSFGYAFMRAFTTVVMRDVCVHAVIGAMAEGRARIYVDLLGYDEVAHHSGIERHDAMTTLRLIDRQVGRIDRARAWVPRPYRIVVLSDHGQSQGATFLGRFGITLEDLVREACALPPVARTGEADDDATLTESRGYLDSALSGVATGDGLSAKVAQRARERVTVDEVDLGAPDGPDGPGRANGEDRVEGAGTGEPVVMASGNLGLIYLPHLAGRATREDIDRAHPGLLEALRTHPGVGFVLVATKEQGSIVLGPAGERLLALDGEAAVRGEDPLVPFGPHALAVVRRADRYRTVADVMVNSFFDSATEEVAAFEELVGSHGGLGGPQSHPFLLVPAVWDPPVAPLLGATDVHGYLIGRLQRPNPTGRPARPSGGALS